MNTNVNPKQFHPNALILDNCWQSDFVSEMSLSYVSCLPLANPVGFPNISRLNHTPNPKHLFFVFLSCSTSIISLRQQAAIFAKLQIT